MDNKPYIDYICPRCKHNIGYRQQYCMICGLQLDWNNVGVNYNYNYVQSPHNVTLSNDTPGNIIKGEPPAIITN